ncbi:MAG: glycosyltransferase family 2 protein [Candidatus Berkelbacteria bacterium]
MKLAIVIPAHNEATVIAEVIKKLPKNIKGVDEIISIVIDDGSSDGTFLIADKCANYAVKHVINMGVGAATTTGFEAAKKLEADIIVTLDADGQHNPDDVEKLIRPILENRADVVTGTRMLNTAGMPFFKIFGNWLMNFLTFMVFHKWSSDSQSGMRTFNKKAISKMCFHAIGYEICSEIMGEVKRNKLRFTEVPIEVIYTKYSNTTGQSWLNAVNILTKIINIKFTGKK